MADEALSPVEQYRNAFATWERRGRGWTAYPGPVELEPAFMPFLFSLVPPRVVDDGRRHTWLSALVERLAGRTPDPAPDLPEIDLSEDGYPFTWPEDIVEIRVALPSRASLPRTGGASFLRGLSAMRLPLSFELEGRDGKVSIRFACARSDAGVFESALRSMYQDVIPVRESRLLSERWDDDRPWRVVDFGLKREFLVPFAPHGGIDPVAAIIAALSSSGEGEAGLVQIIATDVRNPWNRALAHVIEGEAKDEVLLDRQALRIAGEKAMAPLFAAVIRVGAAGASEDAAWGLIRRIASAFGHLDSPERNGLIPLASDDQATLWDTVFDRTSYRTGMLLSLEELSALIHLPGDTAHLVRERVGPKLPPAEVTTGDGTTIGVAHVRGESIPVRLTEKVRSRHVHVIGATGTGKSTMLLSMALDDIARGNGVALLDVHGDLAEDLLARIPEERRRDVILLDPSEPDFALGWNMLQASTDLERDILADDFVGIFRRLSTSWGDQMTAVLSNAVLAFLYSTRGGTLADLRRFLVDTGFRTDFLKTVRDERTAAFWKEEFPLLVGKRPQAPILTRLDTFLRSRVIRRIVSETTARIDFGDVVDNGRIFVAKIAQGGIGQENAALLGSLLVSQFHQATLSRHDRATRTRRPFYLYLDEFHLLATPSMEALFTGARKFGLSLTVAHQDVAQLQKRAPEVADAVLSESYTRIAFRLGSDDARTLARSFASFEAEDLTNLELGEAICRVGRSEDDFLLETHPLPAVDEETLRDRREALRHESLARFARRVEAEETPHDPKPEEPPPSPASPPNPPSSPISPPGPPPDVPPPSRNPQHPPKPKERSGTPGRGGAEHKYLQELIRSQAQAKGFLVSIEEVLLDGGRVDVAMRRGNMSIAVEIAMTPNLEHEIENARKCLAAGFGLVAVVSLDGRFLARLLKRLETAATDDERSRIRVLKPEELLDLLAVEEPPVTTVRGYTVKVTTPGTNHEDIRRKQRAIGELIAKNARRLKGGDEP